MTDKDRFLRWIGFFDLSVVVDTYMQWWNETNPLIRAVFILGVLSVVAWSFFLSLAR